jgi:GNAT superfamily N-acetyltransferase
MSEPRVPQESEVNSIIGFLDQHLRPGGTWSIAAEYPQVFNSANRNNIRVITENDKVIAHAVVKYLLIKNICGIFKVAAIGSVLTDPAHRNQGLSQKILESCLQAAEKEGADFAVLWTDLYDFYRKMGFELAGTEVSLVIESTPPLAQTNLKFLKTEKVSPDAILRLYSQHTCGTLRTTDEIRKSLQIPNARVYTAWDQQNQLQAYAVEGKGADLKGYVHEWGGGVASLLPLLAHIRQDSGAPLTVISPAHAQNLIRHLSDWDVLVNQGFLGMIRPVSYENLFFKIKRHARNLGINDFVLEKSGEGFVIGTKNDLAKIDSVGTLTRLLFGPIDSSQLKPEFQKILPIPMWIWGWDSV